jgi:transglutaminase-like putative cysteine protease
LNAGVSEVIRYQSREDEGTQSPVDTLDRGWGSCRDFAVLFAEMARSLGFGARIVSGYLYNPKQQSVGSSDAGSTHAWAELYVPGAGWITFDPTNRSVGGFNLIPAAHGVVELGAWPADNSMATGLVALTKLLT